MTKIYRKKRTSEEIKEAFKKARPVYIQHRPGYAGTFGYVCLSQNPRGRGSSMSEISQEDVVITNEQEDNKQDPKVELRDHAETYSDVFGLFVPKVIEYLSRSFFKCDISELFCHSSGSIIPDDEQKGPYRGLLSRFFKPRFDLINVQYPSTYRNYEPIHAHDPYGDPLLATFKTNHHPDEDYRVALLTCRRIYAAASPTFKLICKKKYLRRLIRDISECREIYRQIRVDKSDHINRVFISKAIQDNVLTPISALVKGRRRIIREVGAAKMGFLLGGPPGTGKSLLGHYIQSYIRQLLADSSSRMNVDVNFTRYTTADLQRAMRDGSGNNLSRGSRIPSIDIILVDDVDMNMFNRLHSGGDAASLLSYLDGGDKFSDRRNRSVKIRIFTTNEEIGDIEKAFLRSGRLDRIVKFKYPGVKDIEEFLRFKHKRLFDSDAELVATAEKCAKMSFSDIDSVIEELIRYDILHNEWNIDAAIKIVREKKSEDIAISEKPVVGFIKPATADYEEYDEE